MNKDTTIEELREEARRIYGKTRYSNIFDRAADRVEAIERQLAERDAELATARKLLESSQREFAPISAENHKRDVQDFLARAALSGSGDGWRDIASAPKDGTTILAAHQSNGAIFTVSWSEDDGGWVDGSTDLYDVPVTYDPSHWMTLPAPPASPSAGGTE